MECIPQDIPIVEGAVMRGKGVLLALGQEVKSSVWGTGKVVGFSVSSDKSRWAHVYFYRIQRTYAVLIRELQPV
ncbi:MAG: hypothetical protein GYA36_16195 [Veillonellaceae bacterium]|nr:hypothetical protein [Veillonellaceae bacterium]